MYRPKRECLSLHWQSARPSHCPLLAILRIPYLVCPHSSDDGGSLLAIATAAALSDVRLTRLPTNGGLKEICRPALQAADEKVEKSQASIGDVGIKASDCV